MKQPKFAVKNSELSQEITELQNVPQGENSKVFVGKIGDSFETKAGVQTPILLVQTRTDLATSSVDDEAAFFRGWGGANRIVRCIVNASEAMANSLAEGEPITLPGDKECNLSVLRGFKPYWKNENTGAEQQPMQYPFNSDRAGETITSGGRAVYEDTVFTMGKAKHEGQDLAFDTQEVAQAIEVESLEAEEADF